MNFEKVTNAPKTLKFMTRFLVINGFITAFLQFGLLISL